MLHAIYIYTFAFATPANASIEKIGPPMVQIVTQEQIVQLPNPHNINEILNAKVRYQLEGQVVAERTQENIVARQYNLRGGMPPTRFTLDGVLAQQPKAGLALDEIEKIEVLTGSFGPQIGGSAGINFLTRGYRTVNENVKSRSFTFDPSAGVRDGGWTLRDYGFDRYRYSLDYNLYKDIVWPNTGETTREPVRQFNVHLSDWYLPRKTPILDRFMPDADAFKGSEQERITYRVGGIEFTDEYEGKLQVSGLALPWREFKPGLSASISYETYMRDVSNQYGAQLTSSLLLRSGLGQNDIRRMMEGAAPRGEDMNSLYFPGDPKALGPVSCGSSISFPPGTSLYPDNDGYQGMSSFDRFKYTFSPLFAGPGFTDLEQKEIPTNCLHIEKKEPAKSVKYFPYYCTDPVIRGLMELASQSRFRGPWIQARTWIYTDHATLADINKRMFPPVSKARYVNALYEIAKLGGFTDKALSDAKMFEPSLLACVFADDEAIAWFVWTMAQKHAKPTRTWLEKSPKDLTDLMSRETDDLDHVALVMNTLLMSHDSDMRMGGLGFLSALSARPEALRGKLAVPKISLFSSDEKEVMLALSCVEKHFASMPKRELDTLAKFGATDAIKKKAAELRDK